jgi:hypothetical protein
MILLNNQVHAGLKSVKKCEIASLPVKVCHVFSQREINPQKQSDSSESWRYFYGRPCLPYHRMTAGRSRMGPKELARKRPAGWGANRKININPMNQT